MSRDWLARVPRFDPAFGRGYGEEVDWCQKTAALGGRHLYQAGLFVEHVGGQSFGSEEKAQAMRRGNALISGRYPDHDASVQRFIAADPLATPRLALGIALAGQRADPLPVFMAHSLGGGAEVALAAEIATLPAALVLRVGGPLRWQVELHMGASTLAGRTNDLDCLRHMLAPISRIRLIYSCGVGDPDPVALPDFLLSLRRPGANDTVEMRIHDYFPLSPSYTLLEDDAFCGVPDVRSTAQSHISRRSDGSPVPLSEWREAWGRLVKAADAVIVFSQASLDLVKQAYPDAPLRLRPHRMPLTVRAVQPGRAGRFGILGNLNAHKGALVLCEIARLNPTEQFFIIGQCDSAISLPRNVTIHGDYHPEDIADLAERYGICGWLMPAIWPETFSFATREALETGLPVAGFALGAQAEALDAAPNGRTVPLQPRASMAARLIAALREALPMPGENLPASRSRR
jgi:glycosyltransferase involved in cell wall biosynthesis